MRKIKAYITCPVSHTKKRLDTLPIVEEIAKSCGIETFIFKVGGTAKEIFKRDYNKIKSCDIIIAEVSERSHGVGIEIGISYCLGLKRILLLKKSEFVTKMAEGMPNTTIIEYDQIGDLKEKLYQVLKK